MNCTAAFFRRSAGLSTHRPNREPVVAVVGVNVVTARVHVESPRVRGRIAAAGPVVPVAATVVERTAIHVACGARLPADLIAPCNLREKTRDNPLDFPSA